MKKTIFSALLALFSIGASAQVDETFVFCDAQGNTLAHEAVVNVTEIVEDEFGGDENYMTAALNIKNVTGAVAQYSMTVEIKTIANGKLKHCSPSVCEFYDKAQTYQRTDFGTMKAGAETEMSSEWLPSDNGLCTVTYTIQRYSYNTATSRYDYVGAGRSVTVNYCNGVDAPRPEDPQPQDKPQFKAFSSLGYIFGRASDNGKWVTQYQEVEPTASAQLINLDTYEIIDLQASDEIAQHGYAVPIDVTNDGNIIVGSYEGCPAYLNRSTGIWTKLSTQPGSAHAVTPDGKYAVGATNNGGANENGYETGWFTETYPKMWDLTRNEEVYVSDMALPYVDPKGNTGGMVSFHDISPDGRYILGNMFVDYPNYAFILDRAAEGGSGAFKYIGYDAVGDDGLTYTCTIPDMHFCSPRSMSNSGEWVVCNGYFVKDMGVEFYAPVRYNITTGKVDVYNTSSDDQDMYANVIDNDGNIYGGTPAGSPIREFYIRSGKYWYSLRSVLKQKYGIDFEREAALDNTGTPYSISDDGRVFTAMVDPQFGQNMVMKLGEDLVKLCNGLNLLGVYTLDPAAGSRFSTLKQIKLTFDREVEVVGEQTAATFGEWNSLATNGIYIDNLDAKSIIIVFRTRPLEDGKEYTFLLPAGTISVKGDRERTNDDIVARFTGRANCAVQILDTYPADGSSVVKIDNTSSPILLTADCDIIVTDAAEAWIETAAEGKRVCALTVAYKGNSIALYPATTQYLYKDVLYRVVLAAGSVTDVAGGGANAQYSFTVYGSYERETSHTSGVLFEDDFNNISNSLAQWMLLDLDGQNPAEAMVKYEFDRDNTPWNFSMADDNSSDYCAGSHSCYTPAAQSIDWMMTPSIYLPDNLARLTFQAQSYKHDKQDRLVVYVLPTDEPISSFGEDEYMAIIEQGDKVLDVLLTPGTHEEILEGDWQTFTADLSKYEGRSIHIAFGNENRDQSIIFVDNVLVYRDMPFIMTLTTPEAVENLTSVPVAGKLTVASADKAYSTVKLELKDAQGELIDAIAEQSVTLNTGDSYTFTFSKALPLTVGELNRYSIDVTLDGTTTTLGYTLKDLLFTPRKHVVLEEKTGTTCGNCPLGILAIEHMEKIYGSQFIPISIHTYDNDPLGYGLESYTAFLNLAAAPTAVIQRDPSIAMPMTSDPVTGDYTMSFNNSLWVDRVAQEMDRAAEIEVKAVVDYDAATGVFTVPVTLRSAINLSNQNLNIFMVLMEDGILGLQTNYFSAVTDPVLGEWGLGGRHGQPMATNIMHNDVVRMCYGAGYAGTSGLLPQSMKAGEEYAPSDILGGTLPATVDDAMNAKVAVIIIDAAIDRIVNACVAHFDRSKDDDAIHTPASSMRSGRTYNLQGVEVGRTYRGIVIRDGKKIVQ